jgi:hypothetical protein
VREVSKYKKGVFDLSVQHNISNTHLFSSSIQSSSTFKMHQASILSLLFGLASAVPVVEVPSMAALRAEAGDITKRQSANGQAHACGDNGCGDCPWFLGAGTGELSLN